MARVIRREDETTESLLKRFKQQVKKDDIIYECRKREYFLPKALRLKQKSIHARSKIKHKKRSQNN